MWFTPALPRVYNMWFTPALPRVHSMWFTPALPRVYSMWFTPALPRVYSMWFTPALPRVYSIRFTPALPTKIVAYDFLTPQSLNYWYHSSKESTQWLLVRSIAELPVRTSPISISCVSRAMRHALFISSCPALAKHARRIATREAAQARICAFPRQIVQMISLRILALVV